MAIRRFILIVATALLGTAGYAQALSPAVDTCEAQKSVATGLEVADADVGGPTPQADAVSPQSTLSESASTVRFVWRGYLGVKGRAFNQSPAIAGQVRHDLALVIQPEFGYESANRRHKFNATMFGRFSAGPRNGSADVREFNWQYRRDGWSLMAGMSRVFWGATESRHVVDIINQSDMRENFIGDVKLGQLMIVASLERPWAQFEFFALPQFRRRAFPDGADRPRLQLPLAEAEVAKGRPLDWAGRVSISRADVDFHAYYFLGKSREPDLIPVFNGPGQPTALKPIYRHMGQFGADVQYAHGAWLFKGEMMHRIKANAQYQAGVGGVEYGISRLFGKASDIALLSEYQFDNRPDAEWPAPARRGVYAGVRLGVNDKASSEIKAGTVYDLKSHSWLVRAEFNRRLTNQWGLNLEYDGFSHVTNSPALRDFYHDSHLTITLRRYL
jgi:hypothetical protein